VKTTKEEGLENGGWRRPAADRVAKVEEKGKKLPPCALSQNALEMQIGGSFLFSLLRLALYFYTFIFLFVFLDIFQSNFNFGLNLAL